MVSPCHDLYCNEKVDPCPAANAVQRPKTAYSLLSRVLLEGFWGDWETAIMKWTTRKRRHDLRMQFQSEWHRWFAWRPVVVVTEEGGSEYWVWMETVERKWGSGKYTGRRKWRYRPAQSSRDRRLRG